MAETMLVAKNYGFPNILNTKRRKGARRPRGGRPAPILMTLSIVVPYFKEAPKEMTPLLSSLNNQVGVDYSQIEVLLVNDGVGNEIEPSYLAVFGNLNARAIMLRENVGPGMARQAGLDAACGEYVMFCDADDTLHNVGVIGAFLQCARDAPDIIVSQWYEELRSPEGYAYRVHEGENTWMHGKMFRREFLTSNGIRHHPELRVQEDSYFLALVSAYAPKAASIPAITYVWRYAPHSITRRDNAIYGFSTLPEFIRAISLSWARVAEAAPASIPERVYQLACYIYFTTQSGQWLAGDAEPYRLASEAALASAMGEAEWAAFDSVPPTVAVAAYSQEQKKINAAGAGNAVGAGDAGEERREPFGAWIARIRQKG
jgi:hypothetical protein